MFLAGHQNVIVPGVTQGWFHAWATHRAPEDKLPRHSSVGKRLPGGSQGIKVVVVVVVVVVLEVDTVPVVVIERVVTMRVVGAAVVVTFSDDELVLVVRVFVFVVVVSVIVVVTLVVVVVSSHSLQSTQGAQVHCLPHSVFPVRQNGSQPFVD